MSYNILTTVTFSKKYLTYILEINGYKIEINDEEGEALLASLLSEKDLVYSVNPGKDESFYSDKYPEWSVKPHPARFVAGNIYYLTEEEARQALKLKLQYQIYKLNNIATKETNKLQETLDNIE
jgi:hypothetical protein